MRAICVGAIFWAINSPIDSILRGWKYRVKGHKTEHHDRTRIIFIGPEAHKLIAAYLLRASTEACFSPAEVVAKQREERHARRVTPLSCGNRPGIRASKQERKGAARRSPDESYTNNSYRREVHDACDNAFPPAEKLTGEALKRWRSNQRWSPNQLRHTAATEIRKRFGLRRRRSSSATPPQTERRSTLSVMPKRRMKSLARLAKTGRQSIACTAGASGTG